MTSHDNLSGWLVVDKPLNLTSAQVVGIAKRKLRILTGGKVKVGHTGTLDPLATGILPLAIGEATKLSQFFLDAQKSYDFTLYWGQKTDTADAEGAVIAQSDVIPNLSDLLAVIPQFLGSQSQLPPKYSALKVDGKRAYDLARNNIDFELKKRTITIQDLKLITHDIEAKKSQFSVTCSKGTYVRTLGEDIATACHGYGHLSALRRTKVGFFSQEHAIFPDICEKLVYKAILGITEPLNGISAIHIDDHQEKALRFGQSIIWQENFPDAIIFPALNDNQSIVALVSFDTGRIIPKRIFNL
ncbi:MAG: tRNA pseudouridine55 synthase [Dasania sp.]|jgi:tRNA pseudouridine55 synthase